MFYGIVQFRIGLVTVTPDGSLEVSSQNVLFEGILSWWQHCRIFVCSCSQGMSQLIQCAELFTSLPIQQ